MATTNLFVELVIIGTGAAFWLVFAILTVFGYSWISFDRFVKLFSPPMLIPALSVVYILGIVVDRLADVLFRRWDESLMPGMFKTREEYQEAKARLYIKSDSLTKLFEYGRSRIRVCRGWAINAVLIACFLNLFLWLRLPPGDTRLKLSLFGTASMVFVLIGTLSTWYELICNEYERVPKQVALLQQDAQQDGEPATSDPERT